MSDGILKAANLSDRNSSKSCWLTSVLSFRRIAAHNFSPNLSSGIPKTHTSLTALCSYIADSTSIQEMFSPPLSLGLLLYLQYVKKVHQSNPNLLNETNHLHQ